MRPRAFFASALLLAALVYARTLDGELQFDDGPQIESSIAVKTFRLAGAGSLLRDNRPVTTSTFAINYAVGRLDPFGYHAVNLAIHLAAAILLFGFTRKIARLAGSARADWIAAAASAAFALHPLQTESVSYISQRAESLASALYIAALVLLLEAERHGLRRRRGALELAGSFACFALALGAKPMAITMPAAYALVAFALRRSPAAREELVGWRRRALLLTPFVALSAVEAMLTVGSLSGKTDAGFDVPGISSLTYLSSEARALVVYLRLLLWPAGQTVDWQYSLSTTIAEPRVLASGAFILALLALSAVLLFLAPRWKEEGGAAARLAGLGIAWFFVVLSPTSSVVPLADLLAEHRVYLASAGPFVAMAAVSAFFVAPRSRRAKRLCFAALIAGMALLGGLTFRRNAVWETQEALWRSALEKDPTNGRAHAGLGNAFARQGRHGDAIAEFEAAIAVPRIAKLILVDTLRDLAASLEILGRFDEALVVLRQALGLKPDDPDLLVNMGVTFCNAGAPARAEPPIRRALEVAPFHATAWNVLGGILLARRDLEGAIEAFDRASALDPDLGEVHVNRARTLEALGRATDACKAYRDALGGRLFPSDRANVETLVRERCR